MTTARLLVIGGAGDDEHVRYFLDFRNWFVGMFALAEGDPRMETINSSVHDFIEFLYQCGVYQTKSSNADGEERRALAEEARSRLTAQDSPALEVPDSWWSITLNKILT